MSEGPAKGGGSHASKQARRWDRRLAPTGKLAKRHREKTPWQQQRLKMGAALNKKLGSTRYRG